MNRFQEACGEFAREFAARRLLDATGQEVHEKAAAELAANARHIGWSGGLGLALLTEPGWWSRGGQAEGALRALALSFMDLWAKNLLRATRGDDMPPDFDLLGYGPTFEVLSRNGGSAARVARWRDAMARAAAATARFMLRKEAAWGKPGPFTGTGPNHLFLFGASLYRFGRLLGDDRLTKVGERAMRALAGLQASEGYFPEDTGPAVQYHRVTLFGLCDYAAASGDQAVAPYVERGIRFHVRALYPDLSGIETFDQRNRTSSRAGQPGQTLCSWSLAFGRSPLGRRLANLMLARADERLKSAPREIGLPYLGMAALGAWSDPGGAVAALLPCEAPTRVDRLDGRAAIVQRDGWCVALSGYHVSNRPGNPFILDRTQAVSVFQDQAGLVIGGGNDKNKFDAATFDLVESGYVRYFPPIDGRVRAGGSKAVLDLDYGAAHARLTAVVRSAREVELVAGAETNFAGQTDRFNLQVPVGPGTTVSVDGRAVRLSTRSEGQRRWRVEQAVEVAGVRIEPMGGAEFLWPHRPWNSYNLTDHSSPLSGATGILRLTLTGRDLAERTVHLRR
jgi:hypothetical protein